VRPSSGPNAPRRKKEVKQPYPLKMANQGGEGKIPSPISKHGTFQKEKGEFSIVKHVLNHTQWKEIERKKPSQKKVNSKGKGKER